MKLSRREKLLICAAGLLIIPSTVAGVYVVTAMNQPVLAQNQKPIIPFDSSGYEPHQVVNPFPAIINPHHVSAEEANESLLPNELVLGVEINGAARAYPINMLTGPSREIFNDQLGDQAIAATW